MTKKSNVRKLLVAVSVASVGVVAGAQAQAASTGSGQAASTGSGQAFPLRPMRLLCGFAPGGATDIAARVIAQKLTESLGQPMLVENRPGAAGNIAAEMIARGAPDGYLIYLANATISTPSLFTRVPFDVTRDFAFVSMIGLGPSGLVVHPSMPVHSMKTYEASSWYGLIVAVATPSAVVSRLSAETVKALALADVKERLSGQGIEPVAGGAEDFRRYVLAEIPKWAKVIRDAKIPPQ